MKIENVVRVFRYISMDPGNVFYTILMDFSPWRIYYSHEFMRNRPSAPASIKNLDFDQFLKTQVLVSDGDRVVETLFQRLDPKNWRKAEKVLKEEEQLGIIDGSSISLFWKSPTNMLEIH